MTDQLTQAQKLEVVRELLCLDGNHGYSVQLSIWPIDADGNNEDHWVKDYVIHPTELTELEAPRAIRKLNHFLDQYKRQPLMGGVDGRRARQQRRGSRLTGAEMLANL